jgi:hypothetical protein
MFLLSVKMTSSSILDMQRSEWPETLFAYDDHRRLNGDRGQG